jgi:cytosine/adenosine deaminase-related metal-dependent hydrolase
MAAEAAARARWEPPWRIGKTNGACHFAHMVYAQFSITLFIHRAGEPIVHPPRTNTHAVLTVDVGQAYKLQGQWNKDRC